MSWFALPLNPEPWTVGPLSLGRKDGKVYPMVGKDAGLAAYQEAVREEMALRYPQVAMLPAPLRLEFFLWRRLDTYVSRTGRSVQRHVADATNMQKALEDALQGVLYDNDSSIKNIHTVVIEQSVTVEPFVLIHVHEHVLKESYGEHIAIKRAAAVDEWPEAPKLFDEPSRGTFTVAF